MKQVVLTENDSGLGRTVARVLRDGQLLIIAEYRISLDANWLEDYEKPDFLLSVTEAAKLRELFGADTALIDAQDDMLKAAQAREDELRAALRELVEAVDHRNIYGPTERQADALDRARKLLGEGR